MRKAKLLLAGMLAFSLIMGILPVASVNAAAKTIEDYVETSNGGTIKLGLNNKALEDYFIGDGKPFMSGAVAGDHESDLVKVTFKEDGYFFLAYITLNGNISPYIYANASKSVVLHKGYTDHKHYLFMYGMPVNRGQSIYVSCYGYYGNIENDYNLYASFTPNSSIAKPTKAVENEDGTIDLHLANTLKDSIGMRAKYAVGSTTALRVVNEKIKWIDSSKDEEPGCIVTLPKAGTYTLYITCNFLNNAYTDCVLVVNTDDYVKKTPPKPKAPVAMYAGTKVIIGVAEPGATVTVKYDGKNYKVQADVKTGLYIAKVPTALKKNASVYVVQTVNGVKSKGLTVKVTE